MFIDEKTANKVIFISGDVSDGSANDIKLTQIMGSDWKIKTGAEQTQLPNCSPGYDHTVYWPTVVDRINTINSNSNSNSSD